MHFCGVDLLVLLSWIALDLFHIRTSVPGPSVATESREPRDGALTTYVSPGAKQTSGLFFSGNYLQGDEGRDGGVYLSANQPTNTFFH